jgi:DNA polymerase (family 10)
VPAGLRELLRLPGLGPARARRLFETGGVAGLEDLRRALDDGRVRRLPGFGPVLTRKLAEGLKFASAPLRYLRRDVRRLAGPLLERLRALPGVSRAELAGSMRRGRETVADADLLVAAEDAPAAVAAFLKLPGVESVLSSGPEKASVRLAGGLQCDLRAVPASCFGAALQYFTGSKDHNVALRALARRRGLTLSEYGVFRLEDKAQRHPLAGKEESEVYAALGLAYIEPELRENRGELEAAAAGRLPRLVRAADVRGDFHCHSDHTDGLDSLERMARAARDRGLEWIALGDHSRSLRVARGLSVERLRETFVELERVRGEVEGIDLMRSMEVDILEDGSLDYPDDVLDEIDVVVAAVHSAFALPAPEMTARLVRAVSNPRTDILAHPSGRLLNQRPPYDYDAEAVLRAAAAAGTAIELNGQPQRQDADDVSARRARELGAPLALGSDAHSAPQLAYIEDAVVIARRAWLEPGDLLNCLTYAELRARLEEKSHEAIPAQTHRRRGRSLRALPGGARRRQGPGAPLGRVARARARGDARARRGRHRSHGPARAASRAQP